MRTVFASRLDAESKAEAFVDCINTVSYWNVDLRGRIHREHERELGRVVEPTQFAVYFGQWVAKGLGCALENEEEGWILTACEGRNMDGMVLLEDLEKKTALLPRRSGRASCLVLKGLCFVEPPLGASRRKLHLSGKRSYWRKVLEGIRGW